MIRTRMSLDGVWDFVPDPQQQWRDFLRSPWTPVEHTPAPEVRRRGSEPMIVSECGNWGLPQVDRLRACYGGKDPWWFETGIEWGDGGVYPHGVEDRFKLWHLDKVFPTYNDLAAASQRMQFTALKYQIEQMRRHPSIVGYVITEFTDVHWECNGLLDQCRPPKAFHDVIADINDADAIVPDWDRVAYWEGERCEVGLTLSHFSTEDLRNCRVEWWVDVWPEVRGSFNGVQARPTQITKVGTVAFEVPRLERSVRARLELRLYDTAGDQVASNHHEMYFFPRRTAEPVKTMVSAPPELAAPLRELGYNLTDDLDTAELVILERMTDEFRWYVQNGGKVLWLPESSESQATYLGTLELAPREGRKWQGDWASNFNWIRQDTMFREIPTGGTVDFAFADLTPEDMIVGLKPRDFAADVHAGLFIGWIHHTVGLVAEQRFSGGRLLTCTFRLREHLTTQPVAALTLRDMVAHLTREATHPAARRVEPTGTTSAGSPPEVGRSNRAG